MAKRIDQDVLLALRQARTEDTGLWLAGQLDRNLYQRVNKVLEALGGRWNRKLKRHVFDGQAEDLLGDVLTTGEYVDEKQEFQFFETPAALAERMCRVADVRPGATLLEPSAGRGAIAKAARALGATVHCVELQAKLADELQQCGFSVVQADFLQVNPRESIQYDAVVMNPPFCKSQDIAHLRHAYEFLKPRGTLVAVMGAGWTFRQDRRATEFREWLLASGEFEGLPPGTFKESGTGVSTVLVTIRRP